MGIVINMTPYFNRLKWLNSRHEQAWKLHEKYAEIYSKTGHKHDLQFAQRWIDKAMAYGWEIDLAMGVVNESASA